MSSNVENLFKEFEQNVFELDFYADIVHESYKKYLSEIEEYKKGFR